MLDIHFIRENTEKVKKGAKDKGIDPNLVGELLKVDEELRALKTAVENFRAQNNQAAKKIATLEGKEREKKIAEIKKGKKKMKNHEEKLKQVEAHFEELMLRMPSPALPRVPLGKTDAENVEIRTWGEIPKFDFEPKDHVQLGEALDILDIPRGVRVSGSRFYFLKNEGALLELAILKYTLDKLVSKGFTPFIPPVMVKYGAMEGTGYFPGGEEQAYAVGFGRGKPTLEVKGLEVLPPKHEVESDGLYLVGTSEVSVTSYHAGEILEESELPKLYAGISNCFRREAGTYGKDTHGLYRIHQFQKVEQVVICKNDEKESEKMHQMILQNAEEVLQDLKLPYRVVDVCTGDMGQGQVYKNDIECWMPARTGSGGPSRGNYGETHSCSTFWEFQARRLNLKYRTKTVETRHAPSLRFCHTLNNTCIASPRILIPILEIYQQKDGSVQIPQVLRPYMLGKVEITPKL